MQVQRKLHDLIDRRASGQAGFTLIELLVVIIILGILAAVVVFSVSGIDSNAQDSACTIDERTLRTAAEAYYAEENAYPATVAPVADWTTGVNDDAGATPTGGGPDSEIDQTVLVGAGFLSDTSEYNNIGLYDRDGAAQVGDDGFTLAVHVEPDPAGSC